VGSAATQLQQPNWCSNRELLSLYLQFTDQ